MAQTALTDAERNQSLAGIIACISVVAVTYGLTYPLLSLILEARGYSRTVIGLNAAMPAIAMLFFSPLIPTIVNRCGLRLFLYLCVGTEAVMFVSLKLFDTLSAWFVLRFIMGMSAAGLFVAGETWINQIAREEIRGRLMAVYTMVISSGFAFGPAIIIVTGIDGWTPFVTGSFIVLMGLLPLVWSGHTAPILEGQSSFGVFKFFRLAPILVASVFIFSVVESATSSLLPVYGVRSGFSQSVAALMLTVTALGNALLQMPIGWLADRFNRHAVLFLCSVASVIGIVLLPMILHVGVVLWLTLFLWGGFVVGIYTLAMTLLGERFSGAELITANAAFGVLWGLGSVTGPVLSGIAMDIWDPHGLPLLLAVALLALTGFLEWGRRQGLR